MKLFRFLEEIILYPHCVKFSKSQNLFSSEIFRGDDHWDRGPGGHRHLDCDPLMSRDTLANHDDGRGSQVQGEDGRGGHRTPVGRRQLLRKNIKI